MGLFDRSASKLSGRTTLLLAADPGDALLDAARLYDPGVRSWHGRLVFSNGVLLFGPVTVTPELEQQAGLPAGMAVAYYTVAALQGHRRRRSDEAKQFDGDRLVRGLADRLGGTVMYAGKPPDLALLRSVYSEQALTPDQVIEVLRPYGGDFKVEDQAEDTYSLSGKRIYFYVAYWSPRLYREQDAPPAVGAMRSRPLHHWDLHAGTGRKQVAHELAQRVGEAALALASRSGGVALDELGFPVTSPDDLLPRSLSVRPVETVRMSRIVVAVLGAALATTAAAPATMPAGSPAPATSTAPAAATSTAPAASAQGPMPVTEMPEPTPNCPGLPAASRVTREPWAQQALSFSSVWPLTRGRGVTVAVVDSGVDFSPQLAGRVTALDLTGTGLADCVGHGTAVAAIIAASDIQAQGMPFEGVAPAARILSVKVNSQDTGSAFLLAEGIRDAVLQGAQVINVSITTADTAVLRSAVEFALSSNVVIVAAGGNDGTGTGTGPFYPASYPGVLSVGAVDSSGALAAFSDQLSHVAVTAPGVNITSAFPGGYQQDSLTGTSYAAPFVSGVAALVRSRYPRLSARQVVARIEATADGGSGPGTGHGLVNPVEAVTAILGGGSARGPSPSAAGPVRVSRMLPPDRTARSALEVACGSLGVAALVAIGAVVGRAGRRRRWRPGRERDYADGRPPGHSRP